MGIAEETSTIGSLEAKVEELAAGISTDEADLKAATDIRAKEASVFAAEDKDLMETIDMLQRTSAILEREMSKGGASMLQMKNAGSVVDALEAMVRASLIEVSDASRLTAFVQSAQKESDDDDEAGAPAAAVYKSQSGGIVDTIQDLLGKAEDQLADIRKTENKNKNNFGLLEQSLEDEIKFANNDLDAAKKGIAASTEKKATAEGDLEVTKKDLAEDVAAKATLHHDCMTKDATSLAQVSFVQVASQLSTGTDLANYEVVRFVRDLAHKERSTVLAQLASHLASAMHSRNPFGKVKDLISNMISKLEASADADATEKAYCDKELKETNEKNADKTSEIEKQTTRINQAAAKSAKLKGEVATLEAELAGLAKSQAEMDKLRAEEKAAFEESSAELEKGLSGIKAALKVLNEYYAKEDKSHDAADGAGSGIISLLEVCEADFSKNLAQVTTDEEMAVAETYKDRAARREAEIAGLKQALDILESETALVQSSRKHRSFRGALQA